MSRFTGVLEKIKGLLTGRSINNASDVIPERSNQTAASQQSILIQLLDALSLYCFGGITVEVFL